MIGILAAAALSGVVVGIASGLLGIGGGMVMVPLFRLGFAFAAIEATATSLFAIIPTSISGAITHLRNRSCLPAVGVAAGIAGAFTSPLGVHLANASPNWAIMLAAGLVISWSAYKMLKKGLKKQAHPATDGGRPQEQEPSSAKPTRRQIVIGACSGLIAGAISGYVGVGGGFIMVPLFTSFGGLSMKQGSGTSLVAVAILAIPGAITQFVLGNVNVAIGLAVAVGSVPGAILGANLAKRIPDRQLRLTFGAMLLLAAASIVFNEFAGI